MHSSGILILTKHVSLLCKDDIVKHIIAGVKKVVSSNLYVHIESTASIGSEKILNEFQVADSVANQVLYQERNDVSSDIFPFLWKFYSEAEHQCRDLNVNILLKNIGCKLSRKNAMQRPIQCIMVDFNHTTANHKMDDDAIKKFVSTHYSLNTASLPIYSVLNEKDSNRNVTVVTQSCFTHKGNVVLGGTFDHVHTGHKLLLSEAVLMAHKRIVIGITDAALLNRKVLPELIHPWKDRKMIVENFLKDIATVHFNEQRSVEPPPESKLLEVVRIVDPIGPAGIDPNLQCIVVSKETEKGGHLVNKARLKNSLDPLHVHVLTGGVLGAEEDLSLSTKESKVSSSTLRMDLLGKLLHPPSKNAFWDADTDRAYVIGLTGSIASGKSSLCARLQKLGAVIIDCDKLGHQAYEPGTETFKKVVERFGSDLVAESGLINRKVLAKKVFSSSDNQINLADLNAIVWPEIEKLAKEKIQFIARKNAADGKPLPICILDAAVLLEAGWDSFTNEVWVAIIPPEEAVMRVVKRDGSSKAGAERRINSQLSNDERVAQASVVLSTLWTQEVTQQQVEKAWRYLQERLQPGWTYSDKRSGEKAKL